MKFLKILFIFLFTYSSAQNGFEISDDKKTVIPFKLINNLIFVPLNINGVELTFLLDSGVNETILFSLDDKEINFNDTEKIKFSGLGESKNIEGLRADNNLVKIGNDFIDKKHTIFIILDESINFSSHVGIPVHGIIGYHFFKNNLVEIDYITEKIIVYKDEKNFIKNKKRFKEFPITIEGNKPYLMTDVEMTNQKVPSKMLLDLGNSDAIWLFPKMIENFVYNRPNIEDYLGQGFNGDIYGKRSRIHRLFIGNFAFEKPLTAMPDEYSIQSLKIVPNRKGSVGSEILRRFTVIFNYPENKIYLKKNRHYSDPFLFNKTGLDVQHDGMIWEKDIVKLETVKDFTDRTENSVNYQIQETFKYNMILKPQFSVAGCRIDSQCDLAGIRKNDKIISINNKKASTLTLQKINNLLRLPDDTILTFEVERNSQKLIFKITLKDPIPYQDAN